MTTNDNDFPSAQKTTDKKTGRVKPVRALVVDQFKEKQKLPDLSLLLKDEGGIPLLPPDGVDIGNFYHL